MLDQNTDRMWYVIGAVIIGAAIILILNGTMPNLFASVAETFETKTEEVTGSVDQLTMTDGIMPVQPNPNLIPESAQSKLWVTNGAEGGATITFNDGWTRTTLPTTGTEYGTSTYIDVKPNTQYTQSMYIRTDAESFKYLRTTFYWPQVDSKVGGYGHNVVSTRVEHVKDDLWRVIGTGYTKDGQSHMRVPDVFAEFVGGTYAEFGQFKLEEGPVATRFVEYK